MHKLELADIEKNFQEKTAVQNTDICMENGIYGLLGENGAGKTTLMRIICGILQPTKGQVLCDGMDIRQMGGAYRNLLGYLPQDFGYYEDFTAYRFLHYMAALKALPEEHAREKIGELLEMVELSSVKNKKLKTFSGGMLRRVGIAQALLNDPEILILDEPTSGLDPKERVRFRNIISSLGKNKIVILSTHIVSDVEYIADQILIMKNGKIIRMGTEEELAKEAAGCVWSCLVPGKDVAHFQERYIISNLKNQGNQASLRIVSRERPTAEAEPIEVSLEDVYLYYAQDGCENPAR